MTHKISELKTAALEYAERCTPDLKAALSGGEPITELADNLIVAFPPSDDLDSDIYDMDDLHVFSGFCRDALILRLGSEKTQHLPVINGEFCGDSCPHLRKINVLWCGLIDRALLFGPYPKILRRPECQLQYPED